MNRRKAMVAAAFDAAAPAYDQAAIIQRQVAARMADRIAGLGLPPHPRVLEVGCGTGFLTRLGLARLVPSRWLATDIAPAMVARARVLTEDGAAAAVFVCMDGERPAVAGGIDLVCSNLAMQWFDDLGAGIATLAGLVAPGGWLAFSTLADGTFAEWREAHTRLGLTAGTPAYPGTAAIAALLPAGGRGEVIDERVVQRYADARAFVAELKVIGANAAPGRRPLAPGALRRVLRAVDDSGGLAVTYRVACGLWQKAAP